MSWLEGTVQRWVALVGLVGTAIGVVTFAVTEHLPWAWLALAGMLLLAASFAWTASDEYKKRLAAERTTHQPPGGGVPLSAPVEYQANALRQIIVRMAESMDQFGRYELDQTLRNLPRRGVDPAYEPLREYDGGLARLVELGELEALHANAWRIIKT